jgi:hypothetical protein
VPRDRHAGRLDRSDAAGNDQRDTRFVDEMSQLVDHGATLPKRTMHELARVERQAVAEISADFVPSHTSRQHDTRVAASVVMFCWIARTDRPRRS